MYIIKYTKEEPVAAVILYTKPGRRRPILLRTAPFPGDLQSSIPRGWCAGCGREIFISGIDLCEYCQLRKGENI